jgi:hypothetical protein
MESKGVRFSGSKSDKGLFKRFQKKFGSEKAVTQLAQVQMKRTPKSDAIPKINQKQAANLNPNLENCSCTNELVLKNTFCPICPKTCDGTFDSGFCFKVFYCVLSSH